MSKRNFIILILIVVILVLLLYIFSTFRINTSVSSNKQGLFIVQQAFPQYKIIKTFDTGINLQGYVLEDKKDPKKRTITFTSNDGSVIVNGELLAWDRNENTLTNLNQIYISYFTSDDTANKLYLEIKKNASYIQQGSDTAPHKFYAIIDPSCSHCNTLFDAAQPAIKKGLLAVRWIPVGALNNSTNIVNSFFNSENPLKALLQFYQDKKYDKKLSETNQKTSGNLKLSKLISGFPTIIYKTSQGALKISGGNKLPLTNATVAKKENVKKLNEFLLLTYDQF
ncbi:DsbC family protein [Allofrancisella frigidaquae]|uniref:DsbC family protein n=1 Tax=Allofrancisella frigidaquae TaxID=1085644 RepID=A0A6M3HT68_9GAMM|nr:DsbC family protein [Allofrancisella frigidaquae]QIV94464.1 DsbC family protein [Allofrancisella frigidaquae]